MKKKLLFLFLFAGVFLFWSLKNQMETLAHAFSPVSPEASTSQEMGIRLIANDHPVKPQNLSLREIADAFLESKKEEWKIRAYHELRSEETKLPLGTKFIYRVFQDGIPVLNQDIQIFVGRRGNILTVSNHYASLEKADIDPTDFSTVFAKVKEKQEVLEPSLAPTPLLFAVPGISKPEVAYPVAVKSPGHPESEWLVRAKDGEIVAKTRIKKEF